MSQEKTIRWLAILHILVAFEIFLFWAGFFSEAIFPKQVMAQKIRNFHGYYSWEVSFFIPDSLMAITMIIGGVRLLRDRRDRLGKTLLTSASGGLIFLGTLDFVYDSMNGMFFLGHYFSYMLLAIGLFLPPFGVLSIFCLHMSDRPSMSGG